jgi:hypothetical protein
MFRLPWTPAFAGATGVFLPYVFVLTCSAAIDPPARGFVNSLAVLVAGEAARARGEMMARETDKGLPC